VKGAYVLSESESDAKAIIMATGTEVTLAMQAQQTLADEGIATRVVSCPSLDAFNQQSEEYKNSVLPANMTKRVAIEAGVADSWYRYVGDNGKIIAINSFGESAPAEELYKHFGLTVENIVETVKSII
jgi:transketolase (EC 2.2.1.1)